MIKRFSGEYAWASNFAKCNIVYEGVTYPSVEHAYVAAKTLDADQRLTVLSMTAGQAKKAGYDFVQRVDWNDIKISVMTELLIKKFSQKEFERLLIATGDQMIVEGNWWGDLYWGMDLESTKGDNNLGKLLMQIRGDLLKNPEHSH